MATADAAWLEAQYNNRQRVPEAADILRRWADASALVREQSPCRLDLPYGDEASERLDVFTTAQAGAPVLVFIHGGYWRALDKRDHSFVASSFVADGALVVVPNYALCPAVTIEHIALQMTRAVAWAWRHAAEHGGDPRRLVVAGHSAGGHLAAMMLSCRWKEVAPDLPPQVLRGALALSGVFDLEPLRHTPFLAADLQLTPRSVARLSPAFFPRPKAGELFALAGGDESEEFIRQNRLIRDQWGPSRVPVCETVSGSNHFTVLHDFADPQGHSHRRALELLGLR